MEEESWRRYPGIMVEEPWRRNDGGGIMRRNDGTQAPRRHPGGQGHLGDRMCVFICACAQK